MNPLDIKGGADPLSGFGAYDSYSGNTSCEWTLELQSGNINSYRDLRSNKICTARYQFFSFVPNLLFTFFSRLANTYLLIISIIMISDAKLSPYSLGIFLGPFIASLIIYLLKEVLLDVSRKKSDEVYNNKSVKRGSKGKGGLEEVKWRDIETGDVIYLQNGELCPADIIILDTHLIKMKEAICYVDMYLLNGKTERIKKKASSLSNVISRNHQKNAYPQYRKVLTGKLDYEKPSVKLDHFFGLFKLKKDPKVERLSIENFIPRGAILRNTGWIYGLVVYTGNQTKAYNRANYSKMKTSFLEKFANAYFLAGLGIVFILTSISTVLYEAKYKSFFEKLGYQGGISSEERPFSFLILYSPMIPFFLYLLLDVLYFAAKFRVERRFLSRAKSLCGRGKSNIDRAAKGEPGSAQQPFLKINDPNPLPNFGQVEYVFLDKTGTMTKRNYRVKSIYFNNKVFEFDSDPSKQKTSISSNQTELEYPFLKQRDPSVKHENSKEADGLGPSNINLGVGEPQLAEGGKEGGNNPFESKLEESDFCNLVGRSSPGAHFLLEGLMICQKASATYLPKLNNYKYESDRKEEEAVLNFCSSQGFIFQRNLLLEQPPAFQIKLGPHPTQNTFKYIISGTNEFSYKRGRFSVVYMNPLNQNNGDGYLVCKGPEDSMRKIVALDEDANEALDTVIKVYKEKGLKTVIYAKRHLSKEQLKLFQTNLYNLRTSLICKEEEFDQLAETFETNLELMAVIGLQDSLKDGVVECLQTFNDMNLKIWMVTGDEKENAINTAITSRMLSPGDEPMVVSEVKRKDLRVMIKHHLEEIRNSFKSKQAESAKEGSRKEDGKESSRKDNQEEFGNSVSMEKRFVVLNGKSLDVIMRDAFLRPHFIFLLALMKKVVAYNLRPEHKKVLVNIVQKRFYGHPSVLSIGDGFNDTLMFQSASASIELVHKNEITGEYEVNTHTGDIQVSNFRLIPQLMLHDCKTLEQMTEQLLYFFYSFSSLLITVIFLFNMYCYFSESALMPNYSIVVLEVLCLPVAFSFAVLQRPMKMPLMTKFPALYCDSRKKKETYPLLFLQKAILEPFFQGLLVYFITAMTLNDSISPDGHPTGIKVFSALMFVSIFSIMAIKLFCQSLSNRNQITQVGFTLSVSGMLIYLFFSGDTISNGFIEIFNNSQTILLFAFNIIINLLVTLLMVLVSRRFTPSIFDDFNNRAKSGSVTNKMIIEGIIPETKLSTYIKKIFKKPEIIDPLIYDIISSSSGVKSNELKLNKWSLHIRDRNLEKKYKMTRKQKSLILSRTFFAMLLVMFGLYSILDFIKKGSSPSGFGKLAVFVVFLLLMAFTFSDFYLIFYQKFLFIFIVVPLLVKIAFDWVNIEENVSHITVLVSIISTNPLHLDILKIIGINSIHIISYFLRSIVVMISESLPDSEIIDFNDKLTLVENMGTVQIYSESLSIVFNVIITIVCLYFNYTFEMGKRNEFLAKVKVDMEGSIRQDILSILVPKFVQDQLNQGNTTMQQDKEEVTILFCDICDFDKMVTAEGKKVVQLLDGLFRAYDTFCLQHGIQKIETVGKTYMAACGIKECEYGISDSILRIDQKRRIINLALEMVSHASKFTYGKGEKIKIKIGINTGKCIAGVIGHHKPQFSLIGDTVNTTSRLCSTGEDNCITISQEVKNFLSAYHDLEFIKKEVEAKGKGILVTYQLSQRKKEADGVFKKKMGDALKAIKIKKISNTGTGAQQVFAKKMLQISEQKKKKMEMLLNYVDKNPEKPGKTSTENKTSANKDTALDPLKTNVEEDDDYVDDSNLSIQQLKHNKFFLNFPKHQHMLAARFTQQLYDTYFDEGRIFFAILFLFYLVHTIVLIYIKVFSQGTICLILRGVCLLLICLSFIVYRHRKYFIKAQRYLLIVFYQLSVIITLIQTTYSMIRASQNVLLLELMLIFITFSSISIVQFLEVFVISSICSVLWLILYWTLDILNLDYIFVFLTFQFFNIIKVYLHHRYHIKVFNNLRNNESKKGEQETLVSQLLPYHVFEKLKSVDIDNKLGLTEEFNDVSILFADIAGFTLYSSSVTPDKVVEMLRNLFTEFDKMCQKLKIYKVYTIGDCYVALGFNNANKRKPVEEAKALVKMGLEMIDIIRKVRKIINFKELDMRIGIHTGSYIGGIIGTDIVRYDIYGQDVLIANKMESNGIIGDLLISESTKRMLEKDKNLPYKLVKAKEVACKGVPQPIPAYVILR